MDTTPVGVRAASAAPGVLRARRRSTLLLATRRLLAIVGLGLGFWLLGVLLGATSASAHEVHAGHAATSDQVITRHAGAAGDQGSNAADHGSDSAHRGAPQLGLIKSVGRVAHRVAPVITTTAHRIVDQVAATARHVARSVTRVVHATVHATVHALTAPVRTVVGTTARSLRTPVGIVTRLLHRTPSGATFPVHAVHLDHVVGTHHSTRSARPRISSTIDATVTVPANASRVATVTTDSHPVAKGARAAGRHDAPVAPCSPRPCDPIAGGSGSVGIVGSVHHFSATPGATTTSARSSLRRSPAVSNTELVGASAPRPTFAPD